MPAIRCGSAVVPISHLIDICSRSLLGSQQAIPSPRARENHRAMTRDRACGNDVAKLIRAIRDARFGSELKCPRCQSVSVCRWGRFAGRQRYRCGTCRRTFSDLTGTPVAWSKCLGSLPAYRDCMRGSASLRASARSVGVHLTTSFRWRHRLLDGACNEEIVRLCGFVETGTARVICTDTRTWMSNRRRSIARHEDVRSWIVGLRDRRGRSALSYIGEAPPRMGWWQIILENYVGPDAVIISRRAGRASPVTLGARIAGLHVRSAGRGRPSGPGVLLLHTENVDVLLIRFVRWLDRFRGVSTRYLHNYIQWCGMLDARRRTDYRLDQIFDWPLRPPDEPVASQQSPRTVADREQFREYTSPPAAP